MNVTTEHLSYLQARQGRVRNMCILAHVDHGKTTLSDHLIGANGLIHPKMMGELRYLDSRDDEQARGITMKSSSISLLYVPGAALRPEGPRSCSDEEKLSSGYLVNLIDSPGHVDFCSEVSTAARLSDGALVVVDAVEGVCIQTHAVLRQAWEEKVKPTLFINKVDRLIMELRVTPAEAYTRLMAIVTHVNMIMSAFHSEKFMSEADSVLAYEGAKGAAAESGGDATIGGATSASGAEEENEEDTFQPSDGNVAFGSAHDGWAFRLHQFAEMYAEKLGCKPDALNRALWGDWTFSAKDKRVMRMKGAAATSGKLKPMFVQFALEPIWKAYSVCDGEDVAAILGPIVKGRGLKQVTQKMLEAADPKQAMRSVLRAWLPLSEAVLGMAVSCLPSPMEAAPTRVPHLLGSRPGFLPPALTAELPPEAIQHLQRVESSLTASSSAPNAPLVIYVSKMVSVPANLLPRPAPGALASGREGASSSSSGGNSNGEVFLAFGRVYSGVAREGARVHVLSAAYDPAHPELQRQSVVLTRLFLMMGRALEALPEVPAGNVLAIAGLEMAILKSATISSSPACRPLAPMKFQAAPIVKVAVEPAHPAEMPALVEGLRLLNRADPFVEISVMDSGEHVLGAAGEVHLETCLKDLRERFARIELQVSPPLVAFRETVFAAMEAPEGASCRGTKIVEAVTPNGVCVVRVRALPMLGSVASALDDNAELLRRVLLDAQRPGKQSQNGGQAQASTTSADTTCPSPDHAAAESLVASKPIGSVIVADAVAVTTTAEHPATLLAVGAPVAAQDGLSGLSDKLKQLCEGADGQSTLASLQCAWQLGPRRIGPNLLLSTSPTSGTLFEVSPSLVVKASARQGAKQGMAADATAAAAAVSGTNAYTLHNHSSSFDDEEEEGRLAAAAAAMAEAAASRLPVDLQLGDSGAAHAFGLQPAGLAEESDREAVAGSQKGSQKGAFNKVQLPADLWHVQHSVEAGVVAGFQMATAAGPLCEEPLWGVAFEVDVRIYLNRPPTAQADSSGMPTSAATRLDLQEEVYGPFSGQVMTAVGAACRRAVLEADPRLVEAMYLGQVQTSAEALSGTYAVLGRRRARVLRDEMREGSDTFLITAYVPVEASFGLADEMRHRSSGAASASLILSHWERLQVDPFFVPTTEEEREEWGEEALHSNLAKRLIDAVRRRKGLPVEEKVVAKATKQRTLKRNV